MTGSEHAAPTVIRPEADRGMLPIHCAYWSLYLVSIAKPSNTAPVYDKSLIQLLKLLRRHISLVFVSLIEQYSFDFLLPCWLEELLIFKIHTSLGVIIYLGSLHSIVQIVLEFAV